MHIKTIQLLNFRNYTSETLELSEGLNFFVGDNAQGKTNLLEAVYLTCLGRSPRTPRDKELIMDGKDFAQVSVKAMARLGTARIDIYLDRKANKRIAINGIAIKKLGELMGTAACVYFSPDEISVIKEGPAMRRKLLDIALCQMSRTYFYLLSSYTKVLAHRNKLLKNGDFTPDSLDIWTDQLITYGAKIIKTRQGMAKRLEFFARQNHAAISGGAEKLSITFESVGGGSVGEIEHNLRLEYANDRARDIKLGYTNSGPHKDDLKITATTESKKPITENQPTTGNIFQPNTANSFQSTTANSFQSTTATTESKTIDLRSYGSQGQQRSAALSLKLAELDIIKEETGTSPILILDDVFSELDKTRRDNLTKRLQGVQTLISCTDQSQTIKESKIFEVKNGKATPSP